jgi:CBS domain-containing protein
MQIKEIMTRNVKVVPPSTTLTEASQLMRDQNIGALAVGIRDGQLGMITDRDIIVRAAADHRNFDSTTVSEIMSERAACCHENDTVENVVQEMESRQIRRMPVLDANEQLAGIVSLGDIATHAGHELSGEAIEAISGP